MPKNAIAQVLFQAVSKDLKANVALLCQQMQNIVRIFEKAVMGGYSCVNTRTAFDTDLFF